MNDRRFNPTDEDLHGFADGRLDTERHRRVAEYLGAHPDRAEQVEAYRALNARLRAKYGSVANEPVPVRLLRAAAGGISPPARPRRTFVIVAAVLVAAMLGAAAGWLGRGAFSRPGEWRVFAQQAASAYRVYADLDPDELQAAGASKAALLEDLSRRLGAAIPLVALDAFGYRLAGGRLLSANTGPAAQLVYASPSGERLTLYLRADLDNIHEVEFQFSRIGDVNVLYWLDGPHGYAFSGQIGRPALLRVAKFFYEEARL